MRNRKLFAILTLVAFMMTLLPVAAFAADYDRNASILKIDTSKVEADGKDAVKFTVYVRDSNNEPAVAGTPVYVASERETSDKFFKEAKADFATEAKDGVFEVEGTDGKIEFFVKSKVAGETEIAVGLNPETAIYFSDADMTNNTAGIIAVKTITFEATKDKMVKFVSAKNRAGDAYDYTDNEAEEDVDEYEYTLKTNDKAEDFVRANNVDYYELEFKVTNTSNAPVEDADIEFSANKSAVRFNKDSVESDVIGHGKVKVYADKPGDYEIEAKVGGETAIVNVTFAAGDVYGIELAGEPAELVAIEEKEAASFKLKLTDVSGNKVDPKTINDVDLNDLLAFDWVTVPSGSDVDDYDDYDAFLGNDLTDVTTDNLLKIFVPELDEEGKYALRISVDSGKYVDVEFEGREQGKITKITLSYDQEAIALGEESGDPTIKRIDAAGVSVEADVDSKFEFSVNDYRLLFKEDGKYQLPNDNKGVIYATDDSDYVGETLVITVVDTKNDLTATTEMTIGAEAMGIDVVLPAGVLPVGDDAILELRILDANGDKVALGNDIEDVTLDAYVTNNPEGANVSVDEGDNFLSDLKKTGAAKIEVSSNKEADVKVTLLVKVTKGEDTKYSFTKSVTLNFGTIAPDVVIGAKNITMFIGSTGFVVDGVAQTMDQAPFIQDNRTFVPLRAVATALGATNEDTMWDPATQTITLVREDVTATMTIGNNVITLSDGSTVVADVAPFIVAETGRTVIPFRAIAEACGADVEAVFNADGTTNAVTFTQE